MNKKICPNCDGNGFTKHSWESVEQVVQCKACHSEGEIPEDKFVHQTYTQKDEKGKESTTNYVGPLLDADLFTDLRIVV
jgi:DnaJ-class molecular chaperone